MKTSARNDLNHLNSYFNGASKETATGVNGKGEKVANVKGEFAARSHDMKAMVDTLQKDGLISKGKSNTMKNDLNQMASAAGDHNQEAKWNKAQQAMAHELGQLFEKVNK